MNVSHIACFGHYQDLGKNLEEVGEHSSSQWSHESVQRSKHCQSSHRDSIQISFQFFKEPEAEDAVVLKSTKALDIADLQYAERVRRVGVGFDKTTTTLPFFVASFCCRLDTQDPISSRNQ